MLSRKPIEDTPGEKSRNNSNLRSRKKSMDSTGGELDESVKKILLAGGTEEEKIADEERMLDIAE